MLVAAVILVLGSVAIVTDYRSRRIPNELVLAGLAAACFLQARSTGVPGLADAALGAMVGLACLWPFHLLGAMGAGDVKFMAAMGALLGPGSALFAGGVALLAGALLALATLGWRHFAEFGTAPDAAPPADSLRAVGARMPYAAAIVTGALVTSLVRLPVA